MMYDAFGNKYNAEMMTLYRLLMIELGKRLQQQNKQSEAAS